jgi:hypothetical protein
MVEVTADKQEEEEEEEEAKTGARLNLRFSWRPPLALNMADWN